MAATVYLNIDHSKSRVHTVIAFIGEAPIVMLLSLAVATYTLGIRQGKNMKYLGDIYVNAVKDISMILLIIAGSGAFKQVLSDSGVSKQISDLLQNSNLQPLILG